MLYTQHNNDDTIKDERHSLLEKYTSHFIWKVCMWEGVGDWTQLQHIDPHSICHNRVSFLFSCAAQPLTWGPTLLGAGFLYRILSPTGLVSKLTDFLSSPSYIIVQRLLFLVAVTIVLIQPIHSQGYNSDIPRPDAPIIYIGAFPILTARTSRRSIYDKERHNFLLCWLFHLTFTKWGTPTTNYWSGLGELRKSTYFVLAQISTLRSEFKSQLTAFFQIPKSSARRFRLWHHSRPQSHFLSRVFIVTSLIVSSAPCAREHPHSMCAPN